MVDPFAAAIDAMFASSMAVAAVYAPQAGAPIALRVIRSRASIEAAPGFGGGRLIHDTDTIEVRVADVALPARGDTVTIAGTTFVVAEDPLSDVEGLTWRFGIVPA